MLPPELVTGGGIMGELIRKLDWTSTDVGPVHLWPPSLVNTVSIMLSSKFPMILFWGPNLEVIYNDSYIPIFGARHPVLGQPAIIVWGEVWSVIYPMFQQVYSGTATWSDDQLLVLTRNGYVEETYMTWSYSPVRTEDGNISGILTPITETTKRVLGERRLRTLREFATRAAQLEDIETASNNADIPFSVLYLYDAATNTLKLQSTSAIPAGHPAAPLELSLDKNEQQIWPTAEVMAGKSEEIKELEKKIGYLPGGLWTESTQAAMIMPIAGPDRNLPLGVLVLGINVRRALDDDYLGYFELVTGQVAKAIASAKELEEEKKRAAFLAELDRSKTLFFSNVSHEFRTPLTLILGPVEDMITDSVNKLPKAQLDRVVLIQRNALRLLRLVNSLLDFSRIEAGRMKASFTPVDISVFTEDLASVFRAAFEKAGLDLDVDTPPLDAEVYVDSDMWEKIVYNLLSNAFKYTIKGGARVSLEKQQKEIVLRVADSGVGISEEELPKIFERFHRVENSEGRSHEGTGIGLSLTQELVKLHGGRMTLDSKLGVGTTFSVIIPIGYSHLPPDQVKGNEKKSIVLSQLGQSFVEEAMRWLPSESLQLSGNIAFAHTETEDDEILELPQQKTGTVLLADDNSDMREYVSTLLQQKWEVVPVCDGLEALHTLQARPNSFDLMPRMDGFQLLSKIRKDADLQYIPVILLSARAGEEAAVEGLQAGADDYLIKPFAAKELLARVATHIELSKFRRQLEHLVKERTMELGKMNEDLQQGLLERQHAEVALRESEQQYSILAKASPVGIIHTDNIGNALYINDRWSEITGYEKCHGMGSGWLQLVYPDDQPLVYEAVKQSVLGATPFKIEFRYANVSQNPPSIHWVLGQDLPDLDSTGKIKGFVCTLTDITERKQLERERLDALVQAEKEQRQRAIDAEEFKRKQTQFVDMICHEIRNPLNGILNNIDLMKCNTSRVKELLESYADKLPVVEEILEKSALDLECLQAIEQCAEHQRVITDDVIRASKLEANKVVLNLVNFEPYKLMENVVALYATDLANKRIAMDLRLEIPKTMVLHSDPDRISQVLMNLLTNAIKFTEKSKVRQVQVTTKITDANPTSIEIETKVEDTGVGMDENEQAALFQRFSQASVATYHEYGGSGLGLYISKMLVDLLGGTIHVSSKKKQGTTFSFTVRCGYAVPEKTENKENIQTNGSNSPPIRERRILVVEDNQVNQKVLTRQLSTSGYLCDVANNGKEAVDKFSSEKYDIVFMDVEMPIMNGFEATENIRKIEENRNITKREKIVIIGLSGNARDVFAERGVAAGMDDYIVKPYKREELLKKITQNLR